jgi:hypothetical protein
MYVRGIIFQGVHIPQASGQALDTPSTAHLPAVCLLPTHSQSLLIVLSFHTSLNRDTESMQLEQEPTLESHVAEHISDTPSTWHLFQVALLATHSQSLITVLSFHTSLNLKIESAQVDIVGFGTGAAVVGSGAGAAVVGFGAGAVVVGFGTGAAVVGFGTGAAVVGFGTGAAVVGAGTGAEVTIPSSTQSDGTTKLSELVTSVSSKVPE